MNERNETLCLIKLEELKYWTISVTHVACGPIDTKIFYTTNLIQFFILLYYNMYVLII